MELPKGPQHLRYAAWFEKRRPPRHPQDEAALLIVADAFDQAIARETLSSEQLKLVIEGASSPRALIWCNSTNLLAKLSARWPEAAQAIEEMSLHPKSQVRFAAICALSKKTPEPTIDSVLKRCLLDKSARVRWKAAQEAKTLDRSVLIPEMTVAFETEKNPKTRDSIELSLRMLRDGYWLRPESPGQSSITVKVHTGISGRSIDNAELQSKGLEGIVAEIRKSNAKMFPEFAPAESDLADRF